MQGTRPLVMCFPIYRCISSSNVNLNISRESRFIKKIMHGSKKSKKIWYDTSKDLHKTMNIINPANKPLSVHTVHRMTVRNKLFMEHITDLISMGEVSDIINDSIEITHVEITSDFKYVNVFWIHSNDNTSVSKESLQKCAKIIRHELSQLRVIGVVPPIQFVENKVFKIKREVEKKLGELDCEEKLPEEIPLLYAEQMQMTTSHTGTTDQTLDKESVISYNSEDSSHIEIPIMRHDVLGLDHYKIMSRITASLSKSKAAAERRMLDANIDTDDKSHDLISNKVTDFLTQEKQQISDFLAKKRKEEKRKYRLKQSRDQLLNNSEEIDSNYKEDNDNEYNKYCSDKFEENDDEYNEYDSDEKEKI